MSFKKAAMHLLIALVLVACVIVALGSVAGCQVDVSGSVGAKGFYPDSVGNSKIGDPRKPMYEGSGYVERHSAGGQSDYKPGERFEGLQKKEGGR